MNKDEVVKLADTCGIDLYPESRNGIDRDALLSFANACEKIGMEKAAKICESVTKRHDMFCSCADAIREEIK